MTERASKASSLGTIQVRMQVASKSPPTPKTMTVIHASSVRNDFNV